MSNNESQGAPAGANDPSKDRPSTSGGPGPPPPESRRHSPPFPPPPTEAIPLSLGPDGKPLLPKLGPDGKPLLAPPLDKDGKPLPPPPIIDPVSGKELPRPTDEKGRPMPIYVTPEGKPVLDKDGNPIALRFNKEGKPIPLDVEFPPETPSQAERFAAANAAAQQKAQEQKATKVPDGVFYVGVFDLVASIIVTGVVTYFVVDSYKKQPKNEAWKFLTGSLVLSFVGAGCAALPMFAARKNIIGVLWIWLGAIIFLFLADIALIAAAPEEKEIGNIISTSYAGFRLLGCLCTLIYVKATEEQPGQQNNMNAFAKPANYPQGETLYYRNEPQPQQQQIMVQQQPSTMVVQQPVLVQQPMYMYSGMYPYYGGYGGYYGGYPGYGYGSGFGTGLALGMGMGMYGGYGCCPYYDYGWSGGFDGWF